ncbi:MAG: hypothetical protein H6Q20_1712 [Bacteroidetes bacterium]|jgi:hypothetical protein|nr:hypothetical protein [Bacteroidota bacterium]
MKSIVVPFIEALSDCEISLAATILEDEGKSDAIESVNWFAQYPYKPITFFNIARSRTSIFIRFYVHGNLLKAVYSTDQSPVHEDSCVEFFCKLPDDDFYYNFEFNCIGTCSASKRRGRNTDVIPLTPNELKSIHRYPSIGNRARNEMQGIFEWEVTVEIPFELMGIEPTDIPEKLEGNFYKCADKTDSPHFVSWNPIKTEKPDFHRPEFFGELILK